MEQAGGSGAAGPSPDAGAHAGMPGTERLPGAGRQVSLWEQPAKTAALLCFILLNLILGLNSDPIVRLIQSGFEMFE